MKYFLILSSILSFLLMQSCGDLAQTGVVYDQESLQAAIQQAKPDDEIVMANGVWKDVEIEFRGIGTGKQAIILRAEEEGKVTIEGKSCLKLGGEYLIVSGLYFKNGSTPSRSIISFKINDDEIANHCRITNCVIEDFNQANRYDRDNWVQFWGRHNQLDHCYIAGKFNHGATLTVNLNGNEHIRNYHQIENNHFGPRPRKGGPTAETMRIGNSGTSMAPSHVLVADNFFERCNGEVEIISSKSNFNEFRNNIFYECEGSLVTRHGNYCIIDGNIFIGNHKPFTGGVRVINTGHWVSNNYFYGLVGEEFRSALAIMNGIPKSPLNRYNQVTDVVVAYNAWIDCRSPIQLSVGANMSKRDVLPAQEIRSERPERTIVANNLIFNHEQDEEVIVTYDKVDGVAFFNNSIDNHGGEVASFKGLESSKLEMAKINDWLYAPTDEQLQQSKDIYQGFGFEDIQSDVFGNSRKRQNAIGAIASHPSADQYEIDKANYGASWYSADKPPAKASTIQVSSEKGELSRKLAEAKDGDVLELTSKKYNIGQSIRIDKQITIRAKGGEKAMISFEGAANTPAFRLSPKACLKLENVSLNGQANVMAFAPLEEGNSYSYSLFVKDTDIENFGFVMKAYKGSFADTISFINTSISDCLNGIELAAETDDKGDYNAEVFIVQKCNFQNIQQSVINFYRGGYDESTIGGILNVAESSFANCGETEESDILLQTRGIINVAISDNQFSDNATNHIAVLWGEKNNHHSGNEISNSGTLIVEKYLKQKTIY
jgi:poly(beta-D-mannuronate) lyase